jgi:hypothetical protein
MNNIINFDLLSDPLNWVIVFLILYFLALATQYVAQSLSGAGITLL